MVVTSRERNVDRRKVWKRHRGRVWTVSTQQRSLAVEPSLHDGAVHCRCLECISFSWTANEPSFTKTKGVQVNADMMEQREDHRKRKIEKTIWAPIKSYKEIDDMFFVRASGYHF